MVEYGNFYNCKNCGHSWLYHPFYAFNIVPPAPPAVCLGDIGATGINWGCDCIKFEVQIDG